MIMCKSAFTHRNVIIVQFTWRVSVDWQLAIATNLLDDSIAVDYFPDRIAFGRRKLKWTEE